jgi:long-subunit acyl-CoA synthetase (AMP-forming)
VGYSSPFTLTDSSPGLAKGQTGDAKLLSPTFMTAVPLVLDRILKELYEKLNARSSISAPLFTYLMQYKIRWKSRGFDTPRKIAEAIGGRMEYIMVGGAPLNPKTQAIIKAAFNARQVTQGLAFGLTFV